MNTEETNPALEAEHESPRRGERDDQPSDQSAVGETPAAGTEESLVQEQEDQPAKDPPDEQIQQEIPDGEYIGEEEDVVIADAVSKPAHDLDPDALLKAIIEAAIYITDEPLTAEQIAVAIQQPAERVKEILGRLVAEYSAPDRGLSIRELAGGYKMSTKAEHHESIRRFVNKLQAPLKLSLAALETLAVVAYKQPITGPEILDVRGVQGAGVLKTLLDRKLIAAAGRKNVVGKPILYKTTREFLIQFGLNSLAELPTLKEFEELGRFALTDGDETGSPSEPGTPSEAAPAAERAALQELSREQDAPEVAADPDGSSETDDNKSMAPDQQHQEQNG